MKTVFVLGAGMVSRPFVHYLLNRDYAVTLGDLNVEQARKIIGDHAHGRALKLDIADTAAVTAEVAKADLVVSLLPPKFHVQIAELCLEQGKNFLTASYLSPEMEAMNDQVAEKGLIFMNEIGLDPGLDHLTAMEIIDDLKEEGFTITAFNSHCGGIPSRKAANNPLRYKLSWSPAGVLGAITRPSKFRRHGELKVVPGKDQLLNAEVLHVPGAGIFESNPNADALFYGERYGMGDLETLRRGTLRYPGWAQFWLFMIRHDFLNRDKTLDFQDEQVFDAMFRLVGQQPPADIYAYVNQEANQHASVFLEAMESLGLLNRDRRVTGTYSCFDILLELAQESLQYEDGETDLVVLHHEFVAEKEGRREKWTSSMVRTGTVETSAMAFLVGVPAAIAARLILEDKISARGVMIPLAKEVYQPILDELEELGLPHEVQKTVLS